jgi:16S rRNA (cytidine1402-2'-O)-methyltransferase
LEEAPKIGLLSIVGTPIGNLSDITLRAIEALKKADIIACEDTRESIKLIRHLQIDHKPLVSLHQHNEAGRSEQLLENLLKGQHVAVVSDAGMPMVSDPGQRFLQRCLEANVPYEVIPGPSAVTTAAAGCGFPCDEFYFGGFLPNKSGQRDTRLQAAIAAPLNEIAGGLSRETAGATDLRWTGAYEKIRRLSPRNGRRCAKALRNTHLKRRDHHRNFRCETPQVGARHSETAN